MALRARLSALRAAGLWPNDGSTPMMKYARQPTTGKKMMIISEIVLRPVRNKCTTAMTCRAMVSAAIGIPVSGSTRRTSSFSTSGCLARRARWNDGAFVIEYSINDRSLHVDHAERPQSLDHARGARVAVPRDRRRHQRAGAVRAGVLED